MLVANSIRRRSVISLVVRSTLRAYQRRMETGQAGGSSEPLDPRQRGFAVPVLGTALPDADERELGLLSTPSQSWLRSGVELCKTGNH